MQNNTKVNNRKRRVRGNRKRNVKNNQIDGFQRSLPIRAYPKVSKNEQRVTLTYQDTSLLRGASGASYFTYTMRANGLYDPDPLLLTGGISGFNEWGGLYRQYLVESVTVTWSVANAQAFPIIVVFAPSLTSLATVITSAAAVANLAENKMAQSRVLSISGGQDRTVIKSFVDLRRYVAKPTQFDSGIYSGFLGAAPSNPATQLFLNFCGYASSPFSTGIIASLKIDFHTKLYDVQTPLG